MTTLPIQEYYGGGMFYWTLFELPLYTKYMMEEGSVDHSFKYHSMRIFCCWKVCLNTFMDLSWMELLCSRKGWLTFCWDPFENNTIMKEASTKISLGYPYMWILYWRIHQLIVPPTPFDKNNVLEVSTKPSLAYLMMRILMLEEGSIDPRIDSPLTIILY